MEDKLEIFSRDDGGAKKFRQSLRADVGFSNFGGFRADDGWRERPPKFEHPHVLTTTHPDRSICAAQNLKAAMMVAAFKF